MVGGERIEDLAERLELELDYLGARWSEVADSERSAVIGRIETRAPGIARLLCPLLHRFGMEKGQSPRAGHACA